MPGATTHRPVPDPTTTKAGPDDAAERAGPAALAWPHAAIAGVDEVGRGPLAGPVVAAAVVLDPRAVPAGLNDSKKLTAAKREALSAQIVQAARAVAVASLPAPAIDALNIRRATLLAMRRAVGALAVQPARVLVDGRDPIPDLPVPGLCMVEGDRRSVSIAAASIVAKVARDRMMALADAQWPAYGFAGHVGYPTVAHREALEEHGACPLHRRSFGTVRRLAGGDG